MFAYVFVIILGLCDCTTENSEISLDRPRLYGPSEALVKKAVDFRCELTNHPVNQSVLLQLFKSNEPENVLGDYSSLNGEVAVFPKVIRLKHEGNLVCMASIQNNSRVTSTVSQTHFLKVIEPVKDAKISGPVEIYEGNKLELRCQHSTGTHVSYNWRLNGQSITPSSVHLFADNQLVINRATSDHSGSYMCVATNIFNKTNIFTVNSSEVFIRVKDLVSAPDISFTVSKEVYRNLSAMVTCQSSRGDLPVTFSLYSSTGLISGVRTEERYATFKVPLTLNRSTEIVHCQANNGGQTVNSTLLPLRVVPVSGPVRMHYQYDMGENYAVTSLRFYCKAAEGSHPHFQWYINATPMSEQGSFHSIFNQLPEQSILLLSVGRSSAGTYHCEVSDSFDNTNVICSNRQYLDKDVLNRLPILVEATVFGSFAVVVLLVIFCCITGVIYRRREYGEKSLSDLEMVRGSAAYEEVLDLSGFSEDHDELTVRENEFDQASEASDSM